MAILITTDGDHLNNVHENFHRLPPNACFWGQEDMEMGALFDHGVHYDNTHIRGVDRSLKMSAGTEVMESISTGHVLAC